MFLDKKWGKNNDEEQGYFNNDAPIISMNKIIFYVIFVVFILVVIGVAYFIVSKPSGVIVVKVPQNQSSKATSSAGKLPGDLGDGLGNGMGTSSLENYLNAEYLTFGDFYESSDDSFQSTLESYELPINIKVDVANYYEISRKVELDSVVDELNDNGFTVVNNQFSSSANDFFDIYRLLISKEIPIVVTNDFIFYYYQNYLKEVYKEIEKNIFFENVWDINKKLFDISLARYKKRLAEVGLTNDVVLEAARLEAAYFAVSLKLLMPIDGQVNKDPNLTNDIKFSQQEAEDYYFSMPAFLETDVNKEVRAIRDGSGYNKSPVFRYYKDYSYFRVPKNYQGNAKLNNFYLSMRWMNSVFPLYYKTDDCVDCLLDYDDWKINMAAANFVARDIYDNSEIKRQWAIIYKFISFFSGLRADLTYLNYRDVMVDLFGENYDVERIFSPENQNLDADLANMQSKISAFSFLPIEGGFKRDNVEIKPSLGMRILQESYWPNDYIFNQLTGTDLSYTGTKKDGPFTFCSDKINKYRCRGTGMDIVNLLHENKEMIENKYFYENTDYENYNEKFDGIENQLSNFNINSWNSNIYWVTLDIVKSLLNYNTEGQPVYMRNNDWHNRVDINTVLGSWVNLHLPEDSLVNYYEKDDGNSLGSYKESFGFNYMEPNIKFIQELIAKNNMLVEMLKIFNVTEKTNAVSVQLRELDMKLNSILAICKKELSNEILDDDDFRFVEDFVGHYEVGKTGSKNFVLDFGKRNAEESISGVKLLILVYRNKQEDKKIIAIGPVFNYQEK